jgi:hypothetical protein
MNDWKFMLNTLQGFLNYYPERSLRLDAVIFESTFLLFLKLLR